ncbi:MAG: sulfite exporter TauE/SafE family protein [Verrucomicrobiae bacterium]|nr:sulfite exporter TauE/SafE family protein [Verrucomicrobiae bacterium]
MTSGMMMAYAGLGLAAGFASGCFGIGGGALMVPVMVIFFKVPYHVAVGTSLALILPIAVAGSSANFTLQKIDWAIFWGCAISGVIGALAGVYFIQKIPAEYARKAFAIFLVYSAYRLWVK